MIDMRKMGSRGRGRPKNEVTVSIPQGANREIVDFTITKNNTVMFKPIETMRNIRARQVETLERAFKNNTYITTALIHVNKLGEDFRVIDGNHRIIAIRNLLNLGKLKEVKVKLAIYNNLSEKSERELYDILAKQAPQSLNDYLSLHRTEIPLWNIIQEKSFPCKVSIYGSKESIQLRNMIFMLSASKSKKLEPRFMERSRIVEFGSKTNIEDFDNLNRFTRIFMATFGIPGTQNKFSKSQMLVPLYHIWFHNKDTRLSTMAKGDFAKDSLWVKRFEKIIGDPQLVLYMNAPMTREQLPEVRKRIKEIIEAKRFGSIKFE